MGGHNLHRLRDATIPKRRPQIRVPVQHGGSATAEQFDIGRTVDIDPQLHRVEVDAVLGQPVQREQPFLQRAEGKNVLDFWRGRGHECSGLLKPRCSERRQCVGVQARSIHRLSWLH